jgi:hypothetical protein
MDSRPLSGERSVRRTIHEITRFRISSWSRGGGQRGRRTRHSEGAPGSSSPSRSPDERGARRQRLREFYLGVQRGGPIVEAVKVPVHSFAALATCPPKGEGGSGLPCWRACCCGLARAIDATQRLRTVQLGPTKADGPPPSPVRCAGATYRAQGFDSAAQSLPLIARNRCFARANENTDWRPTKRYAREE